MKALSMFMSLLVMIRTTFSCWVRLAAIACWISSHRAREAWVKSATEVDKYSGGRERMGGRERVHGKKRMGGREGGRDGGSGR